MTVRPGQEWGSPVARPAGLRVLGSDAELADAVARDPGGAYAVGGGDLHRTLGSPRPGDGPILQRLPVDALLVTAAGTDHRTIEHLAVAHVVARRSWWRGPIVFVMNADHAGTWNVAPRAHPDDGRADVVEIAAAMTARARWQARRRLPHGTHLPHPAIATRSVRRAEWRFERPLRLWIDGVERGRVTELRVEVQPDAFALHV